MKETWDAVVVGAGPAGAVAAGLLASRGVKVLLVDAAVFPRAKVCGGCLNRRALGALADAELGDIPARLGAVPLGRFRLAAAGRVAEVPLPGGVAVSRESFDAELVHRAVERGATFLPGTRAALVAAGHKSSRRLRLTRPDGHEDIDAQIVLAADGLGGGLISRAGLDAEPPAPGSRIGAGAIFPSAERAFEPGVIHMASGRRGYVGLVRVEGGRLEVAAALDVGAVREDGLARLAGCILREAGFPVPGGMREAAWRGTPSLTRQPRRVGHPRLFVLGDAAGYIEPFTGEGMAWAISSAVAVAPLAAEGVARWRPGLASAWERRHRAVVRRRQFVCRLAAALLRRPGLTAGLAAVLSQIPGLAAPVVAFLNAPSTLREVR